MSFLVALLFYAEITETNFDKKIKTLIGITPLIKLCNCSASALQTDVFIKQ